MNDPYTVTIDVDLPGSGGQWRVQIMFHGYVLMHVSAAPDVALDALRSWLDRLELGNGVA